MTGNATHNVNRNASWNTSSDATQDPIVAVENVAVEFGEVSVLGDVSFDVDPGEFVGVVGPNGAGKTTLLRTISGALSPSRGSVVVDGTDVHDLSSKASSRLIAVVPQDTTLSFAFDVRDVVEMGRHPHRSRFSPPTRRDREIVNRALERTRTTHLADRSIEAVSGGERQRVILARAIAQETPVLLLDEPTASLDVNHQVETLELVRSLVEDGRTVIAAIHDLDLAARYCDRLVMIADGVVHRNGPPEAVLTPETLESAFDAIATVTPNPATGTPTVTTFASRGADDCYENPVADDCRGNPVDVAEPITDGAVHSNPHRVHVIGSGDAATKTLVRFDAAGMDVSIGPIPSGSVVGALARTLDVDRLVTDPFTPLSNAAIETLERHVRDADVTVLADLELSSGNRRVLEPLEGEDSVVVIESSPLEERNSAGEQARKAYIRCLDRAVETTPSSLLDAVRTAVRDGDDRSVRELDEDQSVRELDERPVPESFQRAMKETSDD